MVSKLQAVRVARSLWASESRLESVAAGVVVLVLIAAFAERHFREN